MNRFLKQLNANTHTKHLINYSIKPLTSLLILVSLILNVYSLSAQTPLTQDWTPFPADQKTWFEFSNETYKLPALFYATNITQQGNEVTYYLDANNTVGIAGNEISENCDEDYTSRTQDFINVNEPFTEQNGLHYYQGQLVFNTNLNIGEGFFIQSENYTGFDELYVECVEQGTENIFGLSDDVKVFSLQALSNGQAVNSTFDNYSYILSKSYGFIQFLPFTELLSEPKTSASLTGFQNGEGNLTGSKGHQFKPPYEVGDVIYYSRVSDRLFRAIDDRVLIKETRYWRDSITAVVSYNDSLTYAFNRFEIIESLNYTPTFDQFTIIDTVETYGNQNTYVYDQVIYSSVYNSIYGYALRTIGNNSYKTIRNIEIVPNSFSFNNEMASVVSISQTDYGLHDNGCRAYPSFNKGSIHYHTELGKIYDFIADDCCIDQTWRLEAYQKGGILYPFGQLNTEYQNTDGAVALGASGIFDVSGPGVTNGIFNPSLVPEYLLNTQFDITLSLGPWEFKQSVTVTGTSNSCDTYLGTFFYANCGGINYYFIELEDGRIFDPYFAVDPGYYPYEGQQIRFDFEIKTDVTTPCTISESPITITCFEPYEPNDEPACSLFLDKGTCDEFTIRYYFSRNRGNCKQFTYSGCGGNANNFENYTACITACNPTINCPEGDPLEWDWLQDIINKDDQYSQCATGYIQQFEHNGYTYFKTKPSDNSLLPCPVDFPENIYDCHGNLICQVSIQMQDRCLPGDFDYDILFSAPVIWTREFETNEAACNLPLEEGTCDDFIPRYYYNAEAGICQTFIYTGCDGNANNYETYTNCMNACNPTISCQDGDPLEWDWIQNIIENSDGCVNGRIKQFESNGNYYFEVGPGTSCLNKDPLYSNFYDCNGNSVCIVGLFPPPFPPSCNPDFFQDTQNHTIIWNYEFECTDPFEIDRVQYAILDECTEAIYAFDFEDDPKIYIKKSCGNTDVIYDCNTKQSCGINSSGVSYSCSSLIESVQPLVNDENAIWTNGCSYETTGTVYYSETCGLYIGCCLDSQFEIVTLPESFELVEGQIVEFSYEPAMANICLPLGQPVDISCIRKVADDCGCPPVSKPSTLVCGLDGNTYDNECLANCYANGVAYDGACRVCNSDNPLEEKWIKELIINGEGCTVYEIRQFEYDGATHFAVLPNGACVSDLWISYYDCIGMPVCDSSILVGNSCDPELSSAANSATTIWTYNETDCTNPLETDFVQNWLNNDCTPEAIYSFEFEGETFIYVEPGSYCFDYYTDEANLFYNCNAGTTCNLTSAFLGYYGFSCFGISEFFLMSALNNDNLIWTKPCEYETTGEVINIGDYIPAEYIYDEDCDLVINIPSIGFVVSPTALLDDFTLTEGQIVEFTYLYTYGYSSSACSDVAPVDIICIREAGDNQNTMDRIECPQDHTTNICAPVNIPPSMALQDFSTSDDPDFMNLIQLQMEEQTDVNKYFNTTTRIYTISDKNGNQKTCETKHHIANQFLQMPEVAQPGVVCQEDLWSYVKIGADQYKIYADNNGAKGAVMSTCNTPSLICSTADFGVDTKLPDTYHLWASTYFEFPDGSICESEAMPFYVDVQAKPTAELSMDYKKINFGEGIQLMDIVTTNKTGYWSGENVIYLMTANGDNIPYFTSNSAGLYKLYYTVKNGYCERSYLLLLKVGNSLAKPSASQQAQKTTSIVFNIYPNPATGKVYIDLPGDTNYQIYLTNISGKVMKQMQTELSLTELNISDLPKGMYLVEVRNAAGSHIQKLVIE